MFVDYLQWFPIFRIDGWFRWAVSILMLALVTALNLIGVDVVAQVKDNIKEGGGKRQPRQ
jgi:amino acid transporter